MLTKVELERYNRQIIIKGFGTEGQEKLKKARVFIAGAGGLGSIIAIYLAVSGIGNIRIVDHDKVELSNLNRQVLHWDKDIGKEKANSAIEKLKKLNTYIKIEAICEHINATNIHELIDNADLIVDAMDNLPTRYLLNKASLAKNIPFFHGAIRGFEGRATTFIPNKTACFRCIYRKDLPKEKFPVAGVTSAIIGSVQATEVIKYIVGIGQLLINKLLIYDGLRMNFDKYEISKDPYCQDCGKL